jgi:hypothetical protein
MKGIFFFAGFLYLLLYSACQSSAKTSNDFIKLNRTGYSINYPSIWTLDTSHAFGSDIFVYSASEDSSDGFRENVNVLIQHLPDSITLQGYIDTSDKQIARYLVDTDILQSEIVQDNDRRFCRIVYNHTQGIFRIRAEQYYFVENKKAFVLTFSAETSKASQFQDIGSAILNSFRFD